MLKAHFFLMLTPLKTNVTTSIRGLVSDLAARNKINLFKPKFK